MFEQLLVLPGLELDQVNLPVGAGFVDGEKVVWTVPKLR